MSVQEPLKAGIEYTEDLTSIVAQIEDKGIVILFTFIDDETSTVEASITDNFVETNHSVQDHIAIKPRIYRLRGCVGEVTYKSSNEWIKVLSQNIKDNHPLLQKTLNAMKPITAISGVVSNATQTAIAVVNQLESSYNRYRKIIEDNFLSKKQKQLTGKMQETVAADLNRILELRVPVNLKGLKFETTWTKGDDYKRIYYLQSVSAHQGSNNFITDIEVTIKEFRIATTKITKVDSKNTISVTQTTEVNNGKAKGQDPTEKSKEQLNNTLLDKAKKATKDALKGHPTVYKWVSSAYHTIEKDINARKGFKAEDYINGNARQTYKERGGIF